MTCCRGAGLMPEGLPEYARNGWGHVGIPNLGLWVRAGHMHSARNLMDRKVFHYFSTL